MLINSDNIPPIVIPVISTGEEMWRIGTKTVIEKKIRNHRLEVSCWECTTTGTVLCAFHLLNLKEQENREHRNTSWIH